MHICEVRNVSIQAEVSEVPELWGILRIFASNVYAFTQFPYTEYLQLSKDKHRSQVIWILRFEEARRYSVRQNVLII